ncbi:ANTAR domain-containing protein [Intestinibacillus massiliensis]|nr:ANTAR domain-containing protein [Intestinibacillus massiliensis]
MDRVLIASASAKSGAALAQLLDAFDRPEAVATALSGAEARRMLLESEYGLVIVNTPLPDEFGHELASLAAQETTAGVLLLAKAEVADQVAEKAEPDGVLVVPKPLNRALVFQALRLLSATRRRLTGLRSENQRLQRKIEDIRLVDRAKCILIECCGMTEPEAHAYIEKQAMDRRLSKRAVAQSILEGGV